MRAIALVLTSILALTSSSRGQTPAASAAEEAPRQPAASQPPVDVSPLGVSLDRIRRELAPARETQTHDGPMKLSFTVQVIGQAPKIDLLQGFSLNGPLPYGAPTHREVLDVVTPQAYRAPVVPLSAIAFQAAQKLWQKSKKERCEEELASYRALVMQGVAVAAPRCTQ
jgi:hypothetical protein